MLLDRWPVRQLRWYGLLLALALLPLATVARAGCPPTHRSQAVLRAFQRRVPCPSTGQTRGACPGWVKDHIIPLCLGAEAGGVDTVPNLQWQSVAEARVKDQRERQQCHLAWTRGAL